MSVFGGTPGREGGVPQGGFTKTACFATHSAPMKEGRRNKASASGIAVGGYLSREAKGAGQTMFGRMGRDEGQGAEGHCPIGCGEWLGEAQRRRKAGCIWVEAGGWG